ncbi:type VII secretion target [Actinoplanes sp. KI2]|uniref:type VII secretion target n=1 Tax=Actinoplanes sp. KI2 TaxID=2983315 RepID=UPI0021D5BA53|nr:type VII secretion target [Actinoplanes sp. KI2]MCU7730943.1 type VII secretion target [Actinoplanes sp. KI2]
MTVRHPDLTTHAATVAAIGDEVATAQQAGQVVRAGGDAYGKLCAMVPAMLAGLQDALTDGIGSAADAMYDTAARLRATAESYAAADQRTAEAFDTIRSGG